MERIPDNKILKYNPDTLISLRKMYNLDKPGQMDEAIDLLDDWVKKQSHFVRKDFSRDYLERIIILIKGSVERAKGQLDKICTLRTLLPHFFENCDAKNDLKTLRGFVHPAILPKLTKDHVRIIFIRYEPLKYSPKLFSNLYKFYLLLAEYLKAHDYSNGVQYIIDLRNVNLIDFASQLNLNELKQISTIILEGYDVRVHNFFLITTSKTIEIQMKIFKQLISEKLGRRIQIIKEVEELHDHIPKEMLPADYGGEEKSLVELHDDIIEEFGSEMNIQYFREMRKACTNESLRTSTKYSEDFSGIAGTFRTLSID